MTAVQQNTQAAVVTDGPTIVYQLPILAEKLDGPLLVVGYGSPMKATVKACVKSGCSQIWCFDIDGVLCFDPSEEQNDDGPK